MDQKQKAAYAHSIYAKPFAHNPTQFEDLPEKVREAWIAVIDALEGLERDQLHYIPHRNSPDNRIKVLRDRGDGSWVEHCVQPHLINKWLEAGWTRLPEPATPAE